MAKKRKGGTPGRLDVKIRHKKVSQDGAEVSPGDTIRFHNLDPEPRIVKVGIDRTCAKFKPLGLFIKPHKHADVYVVKTYSNMTREPVFYRVVTKGEDRGPFNPHPEDDPYQVIVVSGRAKKDPD